MNHRLFRCGFTAAVVLFVCVERLTAALSMSTSTSAVSIPIVTTDYNASSGVAQVTVIAPQTLTITSTSSTWTLGASGDGNVFLHRELRRSEPEQGRGGSGGADPGDIVNLARINEQQSSPFDGREGFRRSGARS